MSNRSVSYSLSLNSNVIAALREHENAALRVDDAMKNLGGTIGALGIGLGATALIGKGKEWIQEAADYESAMLRIMNVSQGAGEGLKNQLFIKDEVDKFKIDLQSATDAYGDFLVKIGSSGLAGDQIRKLHDEVLLISKVTATPGYKMDDAVRDIGIMLGEGYLEARHLRALSYVFPQITGFLATEMGLDKGGLNGVTDKNASEDSARQKLAHLISSGKLTKAALSSDVLLTAIEKYSESLKPGLGSSLQTTQSEINVLNNEWVKFKTGFVLDNKGEVVEVFHSMADGVKWLSAHKEDLHQILSSVIDIGKGYLIWRGALLALQIPLGVIGLFRNEYGRLPAIVGAYTGGLNANTLSLNTNRAALASLNVQSTVNSLANTKEIIGTNAVANAIDGETAAYRMMNAVKKEAGLESAIHAMYLAQEGNAIVGTSVQLDMFTNAQEKGLWTTQEYATNINTLNLWTAIFGKQAEEASIQGNLFTDTMIGLSAATTTQITALQEAEAAWVKANQTIIAGAKMAGEQWAISGAAMTSSALEAANSIGIAGTRAGTAFVTAAEESLAAWEFTFLEMQAQLNVINTQFIEQQALVTSGAISSTLAGGRAAISRGIGSAGAFMNSAVMAVGIAWIAGEVAEALGWWGKKDGGANKSTWDALGMTEWSRTQEALYQSRTMGFGTTYMGFSKDAEERNVERMLDKGLAQYSGLTPKFDSKGNLLNLAAAYGSDNRMLAGFNAATGGLGVTNNNDELFKKYGLEPPTSETPDTKPPKGHKAINALDLLKKDKPSHVRGNSVTNITVSIGEINGISRSTFTVSSKNDYSDIENNLGPKIAQIVTQAVNDSQLTGKTSR